MGINLARKIGNFNCSKKEEIDQEFIIKRKEELLKNLDAQSFLEKVESGLTPFDDLMVVYYDYQHGGIGSVYVYISITNEEEGYEEQYGIASEFQGSVTVEECIPFGNEQHLLVALKDTLLTHTKEFENRK